MKVGVNLLWLRPGQVGGSETYVTRMLRALVTHPSVDLRLIALPELAAAYPDLAAALPISTPPVPLPSRPLRVAAESTWLPLEARRLGLDVMHHAGGTAPWRDTTSAVVTIHDLQYLSLPDSFSRVKLAFLSNRVASAVGRADVVTTTSQFVKTTVSQAFAVDPERIIVVPPVVEAGPEPDAAAVDRTLDQLGLDRPFFLYPAIGYPHKNHAIVIAALASVPDAVLVLTGASWPNDAELERCAQSAGVSTRVRRLGFITPGALDALYRRATALVFPSRYEGFGMAALEAMARGCPVIAADATALPETVSGAGLLADPDDAESWAAAMNALLGDSDQRAGLVQAGLARAAEFDGGAAAAALGRAYEMAGRSAP